MALAVALALLMAGGAGAQEVRFEAEVDRQSLTTDDVLYLTVSLHTTGRARTGEPELEHSEDFTVIGSPQRQDQFSVVNMQLSRHSQRTYTLRPRRAGRLTVPAATVTVDDQTLTTTPVTVEVTQSAAPPAPTPSGPIPAPPPAGETGAAPFEGAPAFAVVCRADKVEAFVNEQVTLEVDYYTAYRLPRLPGEQAPKAEGFVAEPLPDAEPEYVVLNGQDYSRLTKRWALFGTAPGEHTAAAATERLMLPPIYDAREFESNTVSVRIRPLPPAPEGAAFGGAVGSFVVSLVADKAGIKAGEALTVRVKVDGEGNLRTVQPPELRVPEWCKVYPSGEKRTVGPRTTGGKPVLGGTAEFEYLVVPRRAGRLEIGPVSLLHFRPGERKYHTARSETLVLDVAPGEVIEGPPTGPEEAALRYIHTDRARLRARQPWPLAPWPYVILGLCALTLAVAGWARVRADRRLADPERARAAGAARAARTALRRAAAAPDDRFFAVLGECICRYLGDRFGLPQSGLAAADIERELRARGAPADCCAEASRLISLCHVQRFAPRGETAPARDEALREAHELIAALERKGDRP